MKKLKQVKGGRGREFFAFLFLLYSFILIIYSFFLFSDVTANSNYQAIFYQVFFF